MVERVGRALHRAFAPSGAWIGAALGEAALSAFCAVHYGIAFLWAAVVLYLVAALVIYHCLPRPPFSSDFLRTCGAWCGKAADRIEHYRSRR